MLLESMEHPFSCFITLTYSEETLPLGEIVRKRDVQLFLKNLRFALAPRSIRYYICSEYGENNGRPHYHGILFGVSPLESVAIEEAWKKGHVMVGTAEHKSMSYVSGYIVKQRTQEGEILRGPRPEEFSLMSRKPGLGHGIVERLDNAYKTTAGQAALSKHDFIATAFRTAGNKYPLGKYLKGKCLDRVGITVQQQNNYLHAAFEQAYEERRGKTRTEIRVERQARIDQEAFRTKPKRRTL